MNNRHLIYLSACPHLGPASLNRLFNQLGDWSLVFNATPHDLAVAKLGEVLSTKFINWRSKFNPDHFEELLVKNQLDVITINDPDYPARLEQVYQPPLVLFYQGNLNTLKTPCLAVVGSRRHSHYGQQAVNTLIKPIGGEGVTIVSGLAIGIDTLAHQSALAAGGLTIAIPGSSLDADSLYPQQNHRLARQIIDNGGLLLSEFAPATPGFPSNFPRRNRLIAGLSRAVLVIEAAIKAGSLITARLALEQGLEVLAVPGPINSPQSAGTNELIANGATPIMRPDDLFHIFNLQNSTTPKPQFSHDEQLIMDALSSGSLVADELAVLLKLDIRVITQTLSLLQINGQIADYGGGRYGYL